MIFRIITRRHGANLFTKFIDNKFECRNQSIKRLNSYPKCWWRQFPMSGGVSGLGSLHEWLSKAGDRKRRWRGSKAGDREGYCRWLLDLKERERGNWRSIHIPNGWSEIDVEGDTSADDIGDTSADDIGENLSSSTGYPMLLFSSASVSTITSFHPVQFHTSFLLLLFLTTTDLLLHSTFSQADFQSLGLSIYCISENGVPTTLCISTKRKISNGEGISEVSKGKFHS